LILAAFGVLLMIVGGLGFAFTLMNPNVVFIGLMLIGAFFIAASSKLG
jgi:hypothetical protein